MLALTVMKLSPIPTTTGNPKVFAKVAVWDVGPLFAVQKAKTLS